MICCWAFGSPAAHAQDAPPAPLVVSDAAQDGSGQIWGIVSGRPGLCRWSGTEWQPVNTPEGVAARPSVLGRLPSGAVVCLWEKSWSDEHFLTAHRGNVSRLVARFPDAVISPRLFGDAAGNVWVKGLDRDVYRIPTKLGTADKPEHVYSFAEADYHPGYEGDSSASEFRHNPLLATEDSRGRMCFWTDSLMGADNSASLRGILRWEDGRMVHHLTLAGLPDKPLDWVAPRGPGRLWVTVHGEGAYDVDTETLNATRVPEPERSAFQYVQQTFADGSDWYVIAGYPSNSHPGTLTTTLWRQRAGVWRKILDGLDAQAMSQDFSARPFLRTSAGLWVGSYGAGAWLLPSRPGPPLRLDWRYGYALSTTTRLFSLPAASGGVIALMAGRNAGFAPVQTHLEARVGRAPSGAIRTLTTSHPLVQDSHGRIWNLDARSGDFAPDAHAALSEWDGTTWTPHPLPPGTVPGHLSWLTRDGRDRLWLLPSPSAGPKAPVFVYDPPRQSWQTFPSLDAALLAQLGVPDPTLVDLGDRTPALSADGRLAYRTEDYHLHFFDGHVWHDWMAKDFGRPDPMQFAFNPPFFSKAGLLCVNPEITRSPTETDKPKMLAWTESGGWKPMAYEPGPNDYTPQSSAPMVFAPPLPVMPDLSSMARDQTLAYWFTSGGILYRVGGGVCKAVFPAGQPTPFLDGRRVRDALTDRHGHTFLRTSLDGADEYVIVPTPDQ